MGTNSYVTKLKAQIDRAITQRDHWKQLAETRNSIVVTEVCPESRSVEEYIIDADSVRASWRLIRGYREQIAALRAEIEEVYALLNLQADLLRQTAIALRGPEPDLTRYSHADIPTRATTAVAELDALRADNGRLRAELEQSRDLIVEMSKHCNATALVADWLERNQ